MIENIVLILLFVFSVVLAGLFAGSEIGMYQLSRLRLRLGVEHKRISFVILSKVLHDGKALLLTILLGTNLAHYAATSIVTLILLNSVGTEHTTELFATLITVPVLFIFAELIPKNIFFYRSDNLMPLVSGMLFVFQKLFTWCGLIMVLKAFSSWFAKLTGSVALSKVSMGATRQPYIKAIYQETREEGFLSSTQTRILDRLEGISHLNIRLVMTGLNRVQMVSKNINRSELLGKLESSVYTRLLVYHISRSNIVGYINIYQCLTSTRDFSNLDEFIKPIYRLTGGTSVTDAISVMQRKNEKIVLVTKSGHPHKERPIGIITMKDLVEELLGELAEW